MKQIICWLLVIAATLGWLPSASACPMCQQVAEEAISNQSRTSADEDTLREARAYNNSILFMLAVPYACLGVLGLLFYRAVKVEQAKQLRSCIATANGETVLEIGSLPPISAG